MVSPIVTVQSDSERRVGCGERSRNTTNNAVEPEVGSRATLLVERSCGTSLDTLDSADVLRLYELGKVRLCSHQASPTGARPIMRLQFGHGARRCLVERSAREPECSVYVQSGQRRRNLWETPGLFIDDTSATVRGFCPVSALSGMDAVRATFWAVWQHGPPHEPERHYRILWWPVETPSYSECINVLKTLKHSIKTQ